MVVVVEYEEMVGMKVVLEVEMQEAYVVVCLGAYCVVE